MPAHFSLCMFSSIRLIQNQQLLCSNKHVSKRYPTYIQKTRSYVSCRWKVPHDIHYPTTTSTVDLVRQITPTLTQLPSALAEHLICPAISAYLLTTSCSHVPHTGSRQRWRQSAIRSMIHRIQQRWYRQTRLSSLSQWHAPDETIT
jgi:hypothetical protein